MGFRPVVFVESWWTSDIDVCTEAEGVEESVVVLPIVLAFFIVGEVFCYVVD